MGRHNRYQRDNRYDYRRSRGTTDTDKKRGQSIANGCFVIQLLITLCLLSMGIIIF